MYSEVYLYIVVTKIIREIPEISFHILQTLVRTSPGEDCLQVKRRLRLDNIMLPDCTKETKWMNLNGIIQGTQIDGRNRKRIPGQYKSLPQAAEFSPILLKGQLKVS